MNIKILEWASALPGLDRLTSWFAERDDQIFLTDVLPAFMKLLALAAFLGIFSLSRKSVP